MYHWIKLPCSWTITVQEINPTPKLNSKECTEKERKSGTWRNPDALWPFFVTATLQLCSVQFGRCCVSLRPHGLQHARLPCPSPTPGACSNSCRLSQWCHPTISSSVVPFSSRLPSFQALNIHKLRGAVSEKQLPSRSLPAMVNKQKFKTYSIIEPSSTGTFNSHPLRKKITWNDVSIIKYWGNACQPCKEVSPQASQNGHCQTLKCCRCYGQTGTLLLWCWEYKLETAPLEKSVWVLWTMKTKMKFKKSPTPYTKLHSKEKDLNGKMETMTFLGKIYAGHTLTFIMGNSFGLQVLE